jgi:hypothetical protein
MGMRCSEMNLDALIKKGSPPWTPSPGVHAVDVWHEYDIPTAGTFRTGAGVQVLFTLIGEPDDRLTVWAYTCLSSEDADRLGREPSFATIADLEASVGRMFAHHRAVFVLADNLKISEWTPLDVDAGVLESATEFLRGIRASLARTSGPGTRFRAELAGVNVETSDLVDA